MTNSPQVSVVIPAYNAERWLGQTLHSALEQTVHDLEVIVVDDGSTDGTATIASQTGDARVTLVSQENAGLSAARNTGISIARGAYVALLDADDLLVPNRIERQLDVFASDSRVGVVATGYQVIDENGLPLGEVSPWLDVPVFNLESVLFLNPLLPSTLMVRVDWFERVGLFDTDLHRYEDWDFALRLAAAGCVVGWVREPATLYRRHTRNMSTARDLVPVATESALGIMGRLFARQDLSEPVMALRTRALANVYLDGAARAYGSGLGEMGRRWLQQACELDKALLAGDPPRWVVSVCGHALGALVEDATGYVTYIAANLPAEPDFAGWSGHRLRAQLLASRAFLSTRMGSREVGRRLACRALVTDPRLIRNRGLIRLALVG